MTQFISSAISFLWKNSGFTLMGALLLLYRLRSWIWNRLPCGKAMKKYDDLCEEERTHVTQLNSYLIELHTESLGAICASLQDIGITVDEDKRINLESALSNRLFKYVDSIADEAYSKQTEHNRKIRQLVQED